MSSTDEHLYFHQIAEDNEAAFREIVHLYYSRIISFAFGISKTHHTAEEITQEVFMKLWVHRREFSEIIHPSAWLYKVAANLAFTYLKRAALEGRILADMGNTHPNSSNEVEQQFDTRERKTLIQAAVGKMPPQQQTVFNLRQKGLNYREIAKHLEISPHTVKNHLAKALQQIKSYIKSSYLSMFL